MKYRFNLAAETPIYTKLSTTKKRHQDETGPAEIYTRPNFPTLIQEMTMPLLWLISLKCGEGACIANNCVASDPSPALPPSLGPPPRNEDLLCPPALCRQPRTRCAAALMWTKTYFGSAERREPETGSSEATTQKRRLAFPRTGVE